MQLLAKAEAELGRILPGVEAPQIAEELRARHEANIQLRQVTEDMLRRLRNVLDALGSLAGVQVCESLRNEVIDMETRIETIQTINFEKMQRLQDFSIRLDKMVAKAQSLVAWSQHADKLVQQLVSMQLSPDERLKRTCDLRAVIEEKYSLWQQIDQEARQLHQNTHQDLQLSAPSTLLQGVVDLDKMQSTISRMSDVIEQQSVTVLEDLEHWKQYSSSAVHVRPWLDKAEARVATESSPKPGTLSQVKTLLGIAQQFEQDCKDQLVKLQSMANHCQQMKHPSNARDEVDALYARWAAVRDNVVDQLDRLDRLYVTWTQVVNKTDQVVRWLDDMHNEFEALQKLCSTVQALEDQLNRLKVCFSPSLLYLMVLHFIIDILDNDFYVFLMQFACFNFNLQGMMKGASEKQVDLSVITQECDSIVFNLSPEGAAVVRNEITGLKMRISQMMDAVRAQINLVSEAILKR